MSQFHLHVEWLDPPGPDEAFGVERQTWGRLRIVLAGECLTVHVPTDAGGPELEENAVVGGMSGLADWLVENWITVLWDIRTPFAKIIDRGRRIPTFSDVREGKISSDVEPALLAAWQHRHTFGHACSDIALPSLIFLPEEKHVGITAGQIADDLNPTVRFRDSWPSEPVWIPKDEFAATLQGFIQETAKRASHDAAGRQWADWLTRRFAKIQADASQPEVRRRWMFGELVANRWDALASSLGPNASALSGILIDAERINQEHELDTLATLVQSTASKPESTEPLWRTLKSHPGEHLLPPYRRGYRLAEIARTALGEASAPLTDLHEVLNHFSVDLEPFVGPPIFRSAAVAGVHSRASVLYTKSHPRFGGVAPTRFAIAAGLGRLLANGHAVNGNAFGAANGHQSRWRETQEANAFAAEFLLPLGALMASADIETLSEQYGISRIAAERHRENRLRD